MAVVVVLAALAAAALGRLGVRATRQARAEAAADAAALAAAGSGTPEVAAASSAEANGATVEQVVVDDEGVTVEVDVGGERGRARAVRSGDGADAGLRAALARAEQLLGRRVMLAGWRPDGLALGVEAADAAAFAQVAAGAGLCPVAAPAQQTDIEYEVCDPPPLGTRSGTSQQPVRSP